MQLNLEMPLSKTCQDGSTTRKTPSAVSWQDLSAQMIPCERQTGSLGQTQVWLPGHSDGPRGAFSTLNILPWPNDAVVLSLSQILETGPIPPRFFLSQKACSGILRRAEKRGKTLPEKLQMALEVVAK